MKILICGDVQVGKSTLIKKLTADMGKAPRGYITKRIPAPEGETSYVYLYDIANPPERIEDSAIIKALAPDGVRDYPEVMDTLGVEYLSGIPEGELVILDEIGSLESKSPLFQKAVMEILGGNYSVLASVKAQNTDFLRAVRSHHDCELYIITPENRDGLYTQLRSLVTQAEDK